MPIVSIIIINYNTFNLTSECIKSIIDKTKDISYEIILVDNASTECNADAFKKSYPNIELIKSPINLGFSKGNNLGIEKAKGVFVLLLNSDTALVNNAIKIVCELLVKNPKIGAASSKLIYPDGRIQHCCQAFPSVWLKLLEFSRIHKLFSKSYCAKLFFGSYFNHENYAEPNWVWGTFFMFPKTILKKLNNEKLNDDYFMYVEDLQWCWDIRKLNYKIAYIPEALIIHHVGSSSKKGREVIKFNQSHFIQKNYSYLHSLLFKILYR